MLGRCVGIEREGGRSVAACNLHTVQIREGSIFKCKAVIVDVALGGTVSLVCGRNIFTGKVSLKHKG
jgi:hypothetical protein